MDKTLGQIAHEAFGKTQKTALPWSELCDGYKAEWESIADAVAAAVKEEDSRICRDLAVGGRDDIDDLIEEIIHLDCSTAIRASIKEGK